MLPMTNKSILRKGYTYMVTGKYPSASTSAYIKNAIINNFIIIKKKNIRICYFSRLNISKYLSKRMSSYKKLIHSTVKRRLDRCVWSEMTLHLLSTLEYFLDNCKWLFNDYTIYFAVMWTCNGLILLNLKLVPLSIMLFWYF